MFVKSIPNLFTVANLFVGIMAIILCFQGGSSNVAFAAILIIAGMLLDALDGRVARLLNAQSEFGRELDSLSDVISFGVAPAFVMYVVSLQYFDVMGILITALFPICGALRLARFNVQPGSPGYFKGLPITAAGGILATFSLYHDKVQPLLLIGVMLLLSVLMISNMKYPNFKRLGFPKSTYWVVPVIFIGVAVLAWIFPMHFPKLVFVPLALYAFYGLAKNNRHYIRRFRRLKKESYEDSYKKNSGPL